MVFRKLSESLGKKAPINDPEYLSGLSVLPAKDISGVGSVDTNFGAQAG